jgi:16S rRNA processing protein RimM
VSHLFATGANDVMVVQPPDVGRVQRLIPFTRQVVQNVDLDEGLIIVDWDIGDLDKRVYPDRY